MRLRDITRLPTASIAFFNDVLLCGVDSPGDPGAEKSVSLSSLVIIGAGLFGDSIFPPLAALGDISPDVTKYGVDIPFAAAAARF